MRNKAILFGKRVLTHELVSGSFYLFISVILSGFFAFLLNLFFARNLTKPDYGVYASLLSLITLFTIPAASLTPIVVRFAGDYYARGEEAKLKVFYVKMTKFIAVLAILVFLIFLVFSHFINGFLKLDNSLYVPLVGFITATSYLSIVNNGFLQGLLKFPFIAFAQISGAIFRILIGILLIFLGFNVFGAVWSAFFSFILLFLLGFIPLKFLFKKANVISIKIPVRELVNYAVPATLAILALSSFISIDVVLVKHFFSPLQAGLYGGMSLVGKVIFYFTGPIPAVMFPLLIKRHAKNQSFSKLFYLALFLVLIPSVLISAFYFLFPVFTVKFFLGKGYEAITPFIGIFGAYIGIFSLLNVCVNLFLSLKKTLVFIPVLIGSLLQIVLISFFHSNFYQIIFVSVSISGLLFLALLFYFILVSKNLISYNN